jgi:hypothetical protein
MDIGTVIRIVEMLDNRLSVIEEKAKGFPKTKLGGDIPIELVLEISNNGERNALRELKLHLEDYLEYQVTQAENALGRGE